MLVINNVIKHIVYVYIRCLYYTSLNVHYHIHNNSPPVPILSQINPVHDFPTDFFNIPFDTIHPHMPRSSNWRFPLGFLTNSMEEPPSPLAQSCHKPLTMQIFCTPLSNPVLGPKHLPQHPIFDHPKPMFFCQCDRQRFPHINNTKFIVFSVLISVFLDSKWKHKTMSDEC